MRSYVVSKSIDELGRIEIPAELRKALKIDVGAMLNISKDGETILLNKFKDQCVICGRENFLYDFRNKKLCKYCIEMIKEMIR